MPPSGGATMHENISPLKGGTALSQRARGDVQSAATGTPPAAAPPAPSRTMGKRRRNGESPGWLDGPPNRLLRHSPPLG